MVKTILIILAAVSAVSLLIYQVACRKREPGMLAQRGYHIIDDKVFYHGGFASQTLLIADVDLGTFKVLQPCTTGVSYVDYAKDKNRVYYNGNILTKADPKTFIHLDPFHGKDANHVFYANQVLSDDPAHFEFMENELARDSYHVYESDRRISNSPSTFEIVNSKDGTYYRDELGIIFGSKRLKNADPKTFKLLGSGYCKDHKMVFLLDDLELMELPDVDPATFEVITKYYAKDKNNVYWRGKPLPDADPASFEVFSEELHCSRDHRHAYHQNSLIPNVDPDKFPKGKRCRYCNEENVFFEE